MKVQVLVDDQDRGTVELTGPALLPYAGVVATFNQIICDVYASENPGDEWLEFSVDAKIKGRKPASRRRTPR